MIRKAHLTAALALGLSAGVSADLMGQDLLVQARRIVVAPDTVLDNSAMLVRAGKIAYLGDEIPAEARRGARVVEVSGTVVPGFIDPHTHLSLGDDLAERISPLTPDLSAADAFDPFDEALLHYARAGITSVGLAPLSANTMAGRAAAAKTGETGEIIGDAAYLKLALVDESLDQNRYPTSRMGAVDLVRQTFAAARLAGAEDGDPVLRALRDVLGGSTRLVVHARKRASLIQALDICEDLGVAPVFIGADDAQALIARLAAARATVVLHPLRLSDPLRRLRLPGELERAGVAVAFSSEAPRAAAGSRGGPPMGRPGRGQRGPQVVVRSSATAPAASNPEAMRISAALAVRHGMSRRAAMRALTTVPAELCKIGDRAGNLRQGKDADFAIYGGDPTDLSARIEAVYVGGQPIDMEATR